MHHARKTNPLLGMTALAALGLAAALPAHAGTTVVGNNTSSFYTPVGDRATRGQYEQVYLASALSGLGSGPVTITSLAFKTVSGSSTNFNFTYSLSTTSKAPGGLSTTFASNVGADIQTYTYQNPITPFTPANSSDPTVFDFVLPTNFTYDSSLGNLLLDIIFQPSSSIDNNNINFADGAGGGNTSDEYGFGSTATTPGGTASFVDSSLVPQTQFTSDSLTSTPEPSTWAAFAFTGLFVAGLMLRARRRQQPRLGV